MTSPTTLGGFLRDYCKSNPTSTIEETIAAAQAEPAFSAISKDKLRKVTHQARCSTGVSVPPQGRQRRKQKRAGKLLKAKHADGKLNETAFARIWWSHNYVSDPAHDVYCKAARAVGLPGSVSVSYNTKTWHTMASPETLAAAYKLCKPHWNLAPPVGMAVSTSQPKQATATRSTTVGKPSSNGQLGIATHMGRALELVHEATMRAPVSSIARHALLQYAKQEVQAACTAIDEAADAAAREIATAVTS